MNKMLFRILPILFLIFKLSNAETDIEEINALGRDARLGQLYDIRTDTFFDESILQSGDLPAEIYQRSTSFSSKFHQPPHNPPSYPPEMELGLNELELIELISGYIEANGSLGFLKHEYISNTDAAIIEELIQFTDERRDQLSYESPKFRNFLNLEGPFSKNEQATHVVVGFTWGLRSFVLLEDKSGNSISKSYAENLLGESTQPSAQDQNITVAFFTDAPPPPGNAYPKTASNLRGNYRQLEKYIKSYNNGLGVKQVYSLISLNVLRDKLGYFNIIPFATPTWSDLTAWERWEKREILNFEPLEIFKQISKFDYKLNKARKLLEDLPRMLELLNKDVGNPLEEMVQNFKIEIMEIVTLYRTVFKVPFEKITTLNSLVHGILGYDSKVKLDDKFHVNLLK